MKSVSPKCYNLVYYNYIEDEENIACKLYYLNDRGLNLNKKVYYFNDKRYKYAVEKNWIEGVDIEMTQVRYLNKKLSLIPSDKRVSHYKMYSVPINYVLYIKCKKGVYVFDCFNEKGYDIIVPCNHRYHLTIESKGKDFTTW